MVYIWDAERLEEILEGGRTNPLVLSCVNDDASPPLRERYVVKAKGLPEVTEATLQNELLGNLLGCELGLTTATPAIINISDVAAATFNHSLHGRGFQVAAGLAAGCLYLPGMSSPVPDAPLEDGEIEAAARLYAFDLFTQNPDRTTRKPNCGWSSGRLVAFDFELCFSFTWLITPKGEPWELRRHGIAENHLLWPHLRGKNINWDPIVSAVSRLTEATLDRLIEALPTNWRRTTDRIKVHMRCLAERQNELLYELQGSLV